MGTKSQQDWDREFLVFDEARQQAQRLLDQAFKETRNEVVTGAIQILTNESLQRIATSLERIAACLEGIKTPGGSIRVMRMTLQSRRSRARVNMRDDFEGRLSKLEHRTAPQTKPEAKT